MHLPDEMSQNWTKTRAGRRSRRIVSFNTVSPYEIDVSGLHVVIDRGHHVSRRVIWSLVLIVCFALMLAQCLDRLFTYKSGPIAVRLQLVRNESLTFPAISICNKIEGPIRRKASGEAVDSGIRVFEIPWINNRNRDLDYKNRRRKVLATRNLQHHKHYQQRRGTTCQNAGKFAEVYTVTGRCFTFQGNDITLPGVYNGLYLSLLHAERDAKPDQVDGNKSTVVEVWEVVIHDWQEVPTVIALSQRQEILKNLDLRFGVSLRNYRVLSRGSNPCEMDPSYLLSNCQRACYEKELIARVGCRMCNGGKEFRNASLTSIRMVDGRDTTIPAWIPDQCDCPTPCNQDIYSFSIDSRIRTDNVSVSRLYYMDMNYEEIQEEYSYEVFALLCDLGGTLGLLLGASVLTMIQILEWFISMVAAWVLSHRSPVQIPCYTHLAKDDVLLGEYLDDIPVAVEASDDRLIAWKDHFECDISSQIPRSD
ncbi:unnamed protein product [Darwinula stevensoni]|uniref:Uncharacterized protein n=1 Tax=Darwinula stevensoni TaxID=69355 RepID=A0A7R9FQR4_9CRUS|nr:unnamed protein product [Darwinula stevensoni]CAG0900006.1 unnamed protein product [Darwinula stevensoni]